MMNLYSDHVLDVMVGDSAAIDRSYQTGSMQPDQTQVIHCNHQNITLLFGVQYIFSYTIMGSQCYFYTEESEGEAQHWKEEVRQAAAAISMILI
jgi:hypothetical protein